jgi:uncharacterized membrane protein YgdD (TMEM256/DUF423 family)
MRLDPLVVGALLGALAVAAGAFGAHALAARLGSRELELWETAARYLMYVALALLVLGVFQRQIAPERTGSARSALAAGWALFAGGVIFSGTVGALALGAPRWLGAVTPVGGLLLIAGFVLFAAAALGR